MNVAAAVRVGAYDVPLRVDPKRYRPDPKGRRYVDVRKGALAQQETMQVAAAVAVEPDNVDLLKGSRSCAEAQKTNSSCDAKAEAKKLAGPHQQRELTQSLGLPREPTKRLGLYPSRVVYRCHGRPCPYLYLYLPRPVQEASRMLLRQQRS
jgi:hypothetical protein